MTLERFKKSLQERNGFFRPIGIQKSSAYEQVSKVETLDATGDKERQRDGSHDIGAAAKSL